MGRGGTPVPLGRVVSGDAVVELRGVRKTFVVRERRGAVRRERRVVEAVAGIDLELERGSLVGYLGPNGAGKSTTVKMLTGISCPRRHVRVAGLDPTRQRIELARRIGVMFGQRVQLWWDLPLADSFELLRHVYRVPASRHRENLRAFRRRSSSTRSSTRPCASCRWASGSAAS